jgi:hypothetical protein
MKPLLLVPIILATFLHISTFNVLGTENINLFPNDWETDSGIGSIPSRCKGNRRRSLEYLWSIIIMKVVFENLEYSAIQFTFEALLISTKKVPVLESGVYLIRLDGPVSFKIDAKSFSIKGLSELSGQL